MCFFRAKQEILLNFLLNFVEIQLFDNLNAQL